MENVIKKPLRLEKVKPLIDHARTIKLDVNIFLIMGMPCETRNEMWDSFRLSRKLGIYSPFISIATPYPGSELYRTCLENGYLNNGFSLDDLFIRSFCISTEDWDSEELKHVFKQGQRFLFISFLRDHPLKFLNKFLKKLFTNPSEIVYKVYQLITSAA